MAAVARRRGRARDVTRSPVAAPEPVLMPADAEIRLRYCSTSRAQELLALVQPSHQWSSRKTGKVQAAAMSRWLVLIVTETGTDMVVGLRNLGDQGKALPNRAR